MFGRKTKNTVTFEEKIQTAKYERLFQTLKDIGNTKVTTTNAGGKEEINYAATCSAMKTKARLALDFVADLEKDDDEDD